MFQQHSDARNVGTHLASGEFIASFDDDDLYVFGSDESDCGMLTFLCTRTSHCRFPTWPLSGDESTFCARHRFKDDGASTS